MKIAVTYENEQIFQHFGHIEQFKVYEIEDGKIVAKAVVDTNGQGHGALAGLLKVIGADVLICGGIGGGAQMALADTGIRIYAGVSGDADQAARALADGSLAAASGATCNCHEGHDHEHGHDCHHEHGHDCHCGHHH